MSVECVEVVITAPDGHWLAGFTRALVQERLVACGHHTLAVRSIYRWRGAIEERTEARVALHTRAALVPELVERVGAEHPYEVACVVALAITAGSPAYLQWILDQTRKAAAPPAPPAG